MAPLARYPNAQSPYWIERRNGCFNVHHERLGLVAECDCLQEARHQISDAEDELEAELDGLEVTMAICADIIAKRAA